MENLEAFAGTDYLTEDDISHLRNMHRICISSFSDHIYAIVDALGFTETELNSAFAQNNQTPYEALLETAQQSTLSDNHFIRPTVLRARSLWKKYQGAKAKI